jgi:N utilization substance protein A
MNAEYSTYHAWFMGLQRWTMCIKQRYNKGVEGVGNAHSFVLQVDLLCGNGRIGTLNRGGIAGRGRRMKSEFLIAVTQLAAERNLPQEMVISAVEAALASAYRKDSPSGGQSNVRVHLDSGTGEIDLFLLKTIVEEVTNDLAEITMDEAKQLRPKEVHEIGEVLEFEMEPQVAGRIAAQTAKQVVIQRLREAERELVFAEFSEREGEVFTATVQRGDSRYGGVVTLDLNGRATAILPASEQSQAERYRPGMKVKVMILEVSRTPRGPEIIATRTHPDLLRRLFEMEVPEIYNGVVEIRGISREAGSRAKVAVFAKQEGVDPVGACVGLRGIRIQNIVNELQGEKIDVIQWSKDDSVFIAHSLSPAQPLRVELNDDDVVATVIVPDRQLSLAIGREGQNARLAAKLTGWKVDIKSSTEIEIERMKQQIEGEVAERAAIAAGKAAGINTSEQIAAVVEAAETIPLVPAASAAQAAVIDPAALAAAAAVVAATEEAAVMAQLEAEEQAAAAAAPGAGLSAEEMLAYESLDLQPIVEEVVIIEEQVTTASSPGDDVWNIGKATGRGPQIRFAEDILGNQPARRAPAGRRRGGGNRPPARGPARGPNRGGGRPPASPAGGNRPPGS